MALQITPPYLMPVLVVTMPIRIWAPYRAKFRDLCLQKTANRTGSFSVLPYTLYCVCLHVGFNLRQKFVVNGHSQTPVFKQRILCLIIPD